MTVYSNATLVSYKENNVKPASIIFLAFIFLVSCAAKQKGFSEYDYKGLCGGDSNVPKWHYVNLLPEDSMEIRKLIETDTTETNGNQYFAVESWFTNDNSDVMVCRTRQSPKDSCTGDWWSFRKQGGEWQLVDKSRWVCI